MYCVIQEIENRKVSYFSTSKKIEVTSTTRTMDGVTKTFYGYSFSTEKFERLIKKAYKISIHRSYRENGKVLKKQSVICTMGYYDLLEFWPGDYIKKDNLEKKVKELGISENDLWNMVYKKLDPIIDKVKLEFEQTEEYKAKQEQKRIIDKYLNDKSKFEEKYGEDTYKYCYDVFGNLMNKTYLNKLNSDYEAQQQYKRSYQDNYRSTYNNNSYSSYFGTMRSNYTEEEKKLAEEVIAIGYKTLAKKLHPDVGGTTGQFQRLGNIKDKLLGLIKN